MRHIVGGIYYWDDTAEFYLGVRERGGNKELISIERTFFEDAKLLKSLDAKLVLFDNHLQAFMEWGEQFRGVDGRPASRLVGMIDFESYRDPILEDLEGFYSRFKERKVVDAVIDNQNVVIVLPEMFEKYYIPLSVNF